MKNHSTHKSSSDEKAPPRGQYPLEETSYQNKNDDRKHFVDGVSVERWILKTQQEQAERDREANVSSALSQSNNDGKSYGVVGIGAEQIDQKVHEDDKRVSRTADSNQASMKNHSTHKSSSDEKAPPRGQYPLEETSYQNKNDDRKHFVDGVSVERWILKTQQEQAERDREANVSSASSQSNNDGKSYGVVGIGAEQIDQKVHEDDKRAAFDPEDLLCPPDEPSLIGVRTIDFPGRVTSGRTDVSGDYIPYAESERMSSDFYVAELFTALRDRFLLVEGVRTDDDHERYRTLGTLFFFLILFVLISVAAVLITMRFGSSTPRSPNPSNTTMGSSTPLGPSTLPGPSTPTDPDKSNFPMSHDLDMTIADSLTIKKPDSFTILDTFAGPLFLETVNRTDTNFTFFSVGKLATIFEGIDPSFVGYYISESWIGHALHAIESYVVEGQVIAMEDMYDGMILKSISGYPLVIQQNPLRLNDTLFQQVGFRQDMYNNGIIHYLNGFFSPATPAMEKSIVDVLVETNEQRNRDLSTFIAMIDALPDITALVLAKEGLGKTLFVPTNQALSTVNLNLMANATMMMQFLGNHIVSGNFVKRCWKLIPTGTKLNDTDLIMVSEAGYELHLKIDDVVTINGGSTIVQEDIYANQGILHVIDKALLVDSSP